MCARDSIRRVHGKKIERKTDVRRVRASLKLGSTCPAHIVATADGGSVKVKHFRLHIDHGHKEDEIKHQRLPESAKREIQMKLKLGVSEERILSGDIISRTLTEFCRFGSNRAQYTSTINISDELLSVINQLQEYGYKHMFPSYSAQICVVMWPAEGSAVPF